MAKKGIQRLVCSMSQHRVLLVGNLIILLIQPSERNSQHILLKKNQHDQVILAPAEISSCPLLQSLHDMPHEGDLELPDLAIPLPLPLLKKYLHAAVENDFSLLATQLEQSSFEQLADIAHTFNYLDMPCVYEPAVKQMAALVQKPNALENFLKNESLLLAPDLQRLLAQKMLALDPALKDDILLSQTLQEHEGKVPYVSMHDEGLGLSRFCICFNQDAHRFATYSEQAVIIWDTNKNDSVAHIPCYQVKKVQWQDDTMLVALTDHELILIDCKTDNCHSLFALKNNLLSMVISQNGRYAVGAHENDLEIYTIAAGAVLLQSHENIRGITGLFLSASGKRCALVRENLSITLIETDPFKNCYTIEGLAKPITHFNFSANESYAVGLRGDEKIHLWNVADGSCLHTLKGNRNSITVAQFNPNNKTIATMSSPDTTVQIWNVRQGLRTAVIEASSGNYFTTLSFNKEGSLLAACKNNGVVALYHAENGTLIHEIPGTLPWISSCCWSADSSSLVTMSDGGHGVVWRLANKNLAQWFKEKITPKYVALLKKYIECKGSNQKNELASDDFKSLMVPEELAHLIFKR